MDTRTVYRYEDTQGSGPYFGKDWEDWLAREDMGAAHNGVGHPHWAQYLGDDEQGEAIYELPPLPRSYLAGFDSIGSALSWFEGFTDVLELEGFELVEYQVSPADAVVDGNSGLQLAFDRFCATRAY